MSTHISPAIIMRTWEFGETDLLVSFFTVDMGRLKGVAKGARKSRRRFANCLELFCLANMEFEPKRGGDLYHLHSGKLINGFEGVRSDFSSLSMASYMTQLTETLFPLGVVDEDMFELLRRSLSAIHQGTKNDPLRTVFEIGAMTLAGYGIDLGKCCLCKRHYAGQGRAVFEHRKGGIACLKCSRESKHSPGLGPDSVRMLGVLQADPLQALDAGPLTDDIICELKPVIKLHIEYRLGMKLKTTDYLE
jgi:DNA repair protein RecO (recombination protein O)